MVDNTLKRGSTVSRERGGEKERIVTYSFFPLPLKSLNRTIKVRKGMVPLSLESEAESTDAPVFFSCNKFVGNEGELIDSARVIRADSGIKEESN